MNKSVIIVAGGSGTRMGANIPKQFVVLNNKPVLMHCIKRYHEYDSKLPINLVLPETEIETWNSLIKKFSFSISHKIIKGGISRFHSVKNGLDNLNEHCLVAIHDGVRPLCSIELIKRCFDEAEKNSNAVPAIRITETIRELKNDKNSIVDRENFRIIQTPQCFNSELLKKAYLNPDAENFTDDAGVFESDGNKIHLIDGEKSNIKITVKEDLIIAAALEKELFNWS